MPYREPSETPGARRVAYDALLPSTRASLAAAARHERVGCLGSGQSRPRAPWAALGLGALVTVGASRLGPSVVEALDSLGLEAPSDERTLRLGLAAAGVALVVLALARSWRAQRRVAGRPFPRGVHLFARELVDARSYDLVLHPTEGLVEARQRSDGLTALRFRDGTSHVVSAITRSPEDLRRRIDEDRALLDRAEADGDDEQLRHLDPFAAERAGWAAARPGRRWPARALRLVTQAVVLPALVVGLGATALRGHAIEKAVEALDTRQLIWFAHSSRWMAGWAEKRWADVALTPGHADLHAQYALLGAHPADFVRRLEAQTGDCSQLSRSECAAAVQALCESRFHDPAALARALPRLDIKTTRELGDRCRRVFEQRGWTPDTLSAQQFDRAVARRDVETLWSFQGTKHPARREITSAYDEARTELGKRRHTPTRDMLDAVLGHLSGHNTEVTLSVTTLDSLEKSEQRLSAETLRQDLTRLPFGPALRLVEAAHPMTEPREEVTISPDKSSGQRAPRQSGADWPREELIERGTYWDDARLEAQLMVRTNQITKTTEVTAVHWVLVTRVRPATQRNFVGGWVDVPATDEGPGQREETTFDAPIDPPLRWSESDKPSGATQATLLDRLL